LNLEALCYLGLLRFPQQLEPSLSLLSDGLKAEAMNFLATLKGLSREELLQRWARLREDEYVSLRRDLYARTGVQLDELPPSLQPWCLSWWADQNG
jgi:hypothetical protein